MGPGGPGGPSFICTTEHCLLRCCHYSSQRKEFFENLEKLDPSFLNLSQKDQVLVLLYGSENYDVKILDQKVISIVITYIKATARFDKSLITQ